MVRLRFRPRIRFLCQNRILIPGCGAGHFNRSREKLCSVRFPNADDIGADYQINKYYLFRSQTFLNKELLYGQEVVTHSIYSNILNKNGSLLLGHTEDHTITE